MDKSVHNHRAKRLVGSSSVPSLHSRRCLLTNSPSFRYRRSTTSSPTMRRFLGASASSLIPPARSRPGPQTRAAVSPPWALRCRRRGRQRRSERADLLQLPRLPLLRTWTSGVSRPVFRPRRGPARSRHGILPPASRVSSRARRATQRTFAPWRRRAAPSMATAGLDGEWIPTLLSRNWCS